MQWMGDQATINKRSAGNWEDGSELELFQYQPHSPHRDTEKSKNALCTPGPLWSNIPDSILTSTIYPINELEYIPITIPKTRDNNGKATAIKALFVSKPWICLTPMNTRPMLHNFKR